MKFQTNWTKHFGDIGMLESLFFILHNRRAVGKNFFDVTVGELKKFRKFETVLVTSSHRKKRMAYKMKRIALLSRSIGAFVQNTLRKTALNKTL